MSDNKVAVKFLGTPIFPSKYYGYIEGERVELRVNTITKISKKTFDCLKKKLGDGLILAKDEKKEVKSKEENKEVKSKEENKEVKSKDENKEGKSKEKKIKPADIEL